MCRLWRDSRIYHFLGEFTEDRNVNRPTDNVAIKFDTFDRTITQTVGTWHGSPFDSTPENSPQQLRLHRGTSHPLRVSSTTLGSNRGDTLCCTVGDAGCHARRSSQTRTKRGVHRPTEIDGREVDLAASGLCELRWWFVSLKCATAQHGAWYLWWELPTMWEHRWRMRLGLREPRLRRRRMLCGA